MKFPSSQTARRSRGNVQFSCRRSCISHLQSSKNTRHQPQLPASLATTTKPISLAVPSIISCCYSQPMVIREVFCAYFQIHTLKKCLKELFEKLQNQKKITALEKLCKKPLSKTERVSKLRSYVWGLFHS